MLLTPQEMLRWNAWEAVSLYQLLPSQFTYGRAYEAVSLLHFMKVVDRPLYIREHCRS